MSCSNCGADLPAGVSICRNCGARGGRGPLKCPRCGGTLNPHDDDGVEIDICGGCRGIWFDRGELETLAARVQPPETAAKSIMKIRRDLKELPPPPRDPKVQYIACPLCERMMTRRVFGRASGVMVDQCAPHGVWLDGNELAPILAYAEKGGLILARDREQRDTADEAARIQRGRMERAMWQGRYAARTIAWTVF